jgi:cytochrome c
MSLTQIKPIFFAGLLLLFSCKQSDPEDQKPEASRFSYQIVADQLDEPLQLEFDSKGKVYWIERTGALKAMDENNGSLKELGRVPLAAEKAPGLIGLLLDKNFEENRQLYLYYSAAVDKGAYMRLSRFTLKDWQLDMGSEQVILKVFWEQPDGEHFGGGMTWDKAGNLLLAIGCDSAPTQYAPYAFTNPGGQGQDGGRTAGNTNDLRGSIIRIKPTDEGGYTIPSDNLFAEGTPLTSPEIYVMGNRNPWRLSIDSQTGYLHWGEVGPDAGVDNAEFGPMGYDEFNVAREAGNYGWPYVVGYNLPYNSYDYTQKSYGTLQDILAPENTSPNNTGLATLPPAKPALVAYPYQVSSEWPILSSAARSAVGGPVFRAADFRNSPRPFPAYFEGKWLVTDYVRNWIMVISMDESREKALAIEPLLPKELLEHKQPLDMDFGPSGDLYLVEYGLAGQGRISKIMYNAGNRAPVAIAETDKDSGVLPLKLHLSAAESHDPDGDRLLYEWTLNGKAFHNADKVKPSVTLDTPGKYELILKVKDKSGLEDSDTLFIVAGNEKPEVSLNLSAGNKSFFFPDHQIQYAVSVTDPGSESVNLENLNVSVEYIPSGLNPKELRQLLKLSEASSDTPLRFLKTKQLLTIYNCMSCHREKEDLVGPAYEKVALRYKDEKSVYQILERSIKEGSTGKWGHNHMPPHPMVSAEESLELVDYILSLNTNTSSSQKLPQTGGFPLKSFPLRKQVSRLGKFYKFQHEPGSYLLMAKYTDSGHPDVDGLALTDQDYILLRYPLLTPESADYFSETGISYTPSTDDPGFIMTGKGGYIGYRQLDLTGVQEVAVGVLTRFWHWSHFIGGDLELRLDAPDGPLIGSQKVIAPITKPGEGPFFGDAAGKPVHFDVGKYSGVHDLYLLIKNQGAKESDALIILTALEFIPKTK